MSTLTRADDRAERRRLFKRDPHCHWCGIETVDPLKAWDGNRDRMATVDHIKSRLECTTQQAYRSGGNKVLACLKCNDGRNRVFMLQHHQRRRHQGHSLRTVTVKVPPELNAAFTLATTPERPILPP